MTIKVAQLISRKNKKDDASDKAHSDASSDEDAKDMQLSHPKSPQYKSAQKRKQFKL